MQHNGIYCGLNNKSNNYIHFMVAKIKKLCVVLVLKLENIIDKT